MRHYDTLMSSKPIGYPSLFRTIGSPLRRSPQGPLPPTTSSQGFHTVQVVIACEVPRNRHGDLKEEKMRAVHALKGKAKHLKRVGFASRDASGYIYANAKGEPVWLIGRNPEQSL